MADTSTTTKKKTREHRAKEITNAYLLKLRKLDKLFASDVMGVATMVWLDHSKWPRANSTADKSHPSV